MYDQSKKLASCHLFDDIRRKRKNALIRAHEKSSQRCGCSFCLADWLGAWVPSPYGDSPILASPVATGEVASNASRWGRSWLAFISDTMKVYSLRSWRPLHRLRGPPPPLWQGRLEVRSVPLRGYSFEIVLGLDYSCENNRVFPSPCGDMVLKYLVRAGAWAISEEEFPSPYGVPPA